MHTCITGILFDRNMFLLILGLVDPHRCRLPCLSQISRCFRSLSWTFALYARATSHLIIFEVRTCISAPSLTCASILSYTIVTAYSLLKRGFSISHPTRVVNNYRPHVIRSTSAAYCAFTMGTIQLLTPSDITLHRSSPCLQSATT